MRRAGLELGNQSRVSASGPDCQDSSSLLLNQERKFISTTSRPDRLRKQQLNLHLLDFDEQGRHDDGTELCFTNWPTQLTGSLVKVNRQKAERINQELQEKFCHMFQSETAIDYACDHDRVLREHFPQVARSHREEVLPPELEEVFEPRQLDLDEPEGEETETARTLSERERRELLWQHRNLGHPQPTELARALRHAGARREAIRFVLKELRCPTCDPRPLPLPPRPGMLPRCLRLNQCIGVDLVDLEVRDGTSAKALNVVCWGTSLQIVQASCNGYTVHAVMSEFKAALGEALWLARDPCP